MRTLILIMAVMLTPWVAQAGSPVDYQVLGKTFEGYFTKAKNRSNGMVLIIHDWDGLTDYEIKRAEMLSNMGFDAFALDLYGKGNRPKESGALKAETGKLYKDRERMRQLILGALTEARKHGHHKVVVVGYCFGGAVALELARSGKAEDIAGYATFHGWLSTPKGQSYPKNTPPLLIAHGGGDTSISMDDVAAFSKELEGVGVPYEIQVYSGAPHAFTVFDSNRYRKVADEQSWDALSKFLNKNLSNR